MNDIQRRHHERLTRVRSFVESLAEPFPADSRGGQAFTKIKQAIDEAEELDAAKFTHEREAQQGTSQRSEAREQLRAQVSAIASTARAIGADHPEVRDRFRAAPSKLNDQALLGTARSFLAEATPRKALFLEYAMPANFLETLTASINNFEQAINQQNTGAGRRGQARTGVDGAHARGERELRKLDTIVRNKYRADEATLNAWESASRLERAPRSNRTDTTTTGTPAPPAS